MSRTTSRTAGKLNRALQQVEANIADAHVQKAVTKVIEHHYKYTNNLVVAACNIAARNGAPPTYPR